MALAINIEDLLNKQKIESNRIEFKKGWNPASIYHSVCAFANDFEDLGGGSGTPFRYNMQHKINFS
jgi:ATP-dependent DNA helicase RecG